MADKEGARKSGKFIAVSLTPDVCKTPVGGTVVPVPYMIKADLSDSFITSPNVRFGGDPVFIHDKSKVSRVTGDEAGTAGGVASGTHKGIVESIQGSSTVFVNGKPVVRHGDPCKMNDGNTIGRFIYQGASEDGAAGGDTNPPVVPETPEEEQAAREKRGLWAQISEEVHTGLDVAGFIPGAGILADLANAGLYAAEGNLPMAGVAAVAAAPGIGDGIKVGAMAAKAGKQVAGEAAEKGVKEATEGAAGKVGRDGVRITGTRMKRHTNAAKRTTQSGIGVTRHSVQQKVNRQVRSADELDAIKNPLDVRPVKVDKLGRPSQRFIGRKAEVVRNPETGNIISVNPTSTKKAERLLRRLGDQ